jgi:hypothetical protein
LLQTGTSSALLGHQDVDLAMDDGVLDAGKPLRPGALHSTGDDPNLVATDHHQQDSSDRKSSRFRVQRTASIRDG